MKRFLAAAMVCAALTACEGPDPSPPVTTPKADASATLGMTECGSFTLGQGERLPEPAARCLIEAVSAGRPARLAMTRPTTEGDLIPVTYTAGAGGRVEVVRDARRDEFGEQVVTRQTCTGPVAEPRFEVEFAWCSEPVPAG